MVFRFLSASEPILHPCPKSQIFKKEKNMRLLLLNPGARGQALSSLARDRLHGPSLKIPDLDWKGN